MNFLRWSAGLNRFRLEAIHDFHSGYAKVERLVEPAVKVGVRFDCIDALPQDFEVAARAPDGRVDPPVQVLPHDPHLLRAEFATMEVGFDNGSQNARHLVHPEVRFVHFTLSRVTEMPVPPFRYRGDTYTKRQKSYVSAPGDRQLTENATSQALRFLARE